ncbi:hypothetical protein [Ruminococcus sp.]|uniref:hypothetical protein n=1 Tax=Ruminococcus sp. TaxID=41978 RepID=UPI0025DB162D|nr:hypothetical protein [Ruminococcus sp.]MBQ8966195.1 hypothetical protein [Ruminococcus sp.]
MKNIKSHLILTSIATDLFLIFFRIFAMKTVVVQTDFLVWKVKEERPFMYVILIVLLAASAVLLAAAGGKIEADNSKERGMMDTPEIFGKLIKYDLISLIPICFLMCLIIDKLNDSVLLSLFGIDVLADSFIFYIKAVLIKVVCFDLPCAFIMPKMTDKYSEKRKHKDELIKQHSEKISD